MTTPPPRPETPAPAAEVRPADTGPTSADAAPVPVGADSASPPLQRPRRRLVRFLTGLLARLTRGLAELSHVLSEQVMGGLLLLGLAGLLLLSLPLSEVGSRWLLDRVPGLKAEGVSGALVGDFEVERLVFRWGRQQVEVDGLAWRGPALDLPPAARLFDAAAWTLSLAELRARRLHYRSDEPESGPLRLPAELSLPLTLDLARLQIDRLELDSLPGRPIEGLQARLHLGGSPAAEHQVDALALQWDRLSAQGQARLTATAPLRLDAQLGLASKALAADPALPAWQAQVHASGPLADFNLDLKLQALGQQLEARAQIQPEARLPLRELVASLQGLDLSALASGLPQTALSGQIDARLQALAAAPSTSSAQPVPPAKPGGPAARPALPAAAAPASITALSLRAQLQNARPARLDQGGLPLSSLQVEARTDPASLAETALQGRVEHLALDLAGNLAASVPAGPRATTTTTTTTGSRSAAGTSAPTSTSSPRLAAGQVRGQGHWRIAQGRLLLEAEARVEDLQPALLDQRAPALVVSGPFTLALDQPLDRSLPAPTATRPAAAPPPIGAASAAAPMVGDPHHARLRLSLDMGGRLARPALRSRTPATSAASATDAPFGYEGDERPGVRLRLQARAGQGQVQLDQLEAQSAGSRLHAQGSLLQTEGRWRLDLDSSLEDFDPSLWWPGSHDSAWRRGPHRLAGTLKTQLELPAASLGAASGTSDAAGTEGQAALGGATAWLGALRGQAELRLSSSLVAGVPVAGSLTLRSGGNPGGAGATGTGSPVGGVSGSGSDILPAALAAGNLQLRADLSAGERAAATSALTSGGLGLSLQGDLDPRQPAADRWQLRWDGKDLDVLQAWWRLAGLPLAVQGESQGQLELQGRWPRLSGRGEVQARQLLLSDRPSAAMDTSRPGRAYSLALEGLQARGEFDTQPEAASRLQLRLGQLRGSNGLRGRDLQLDLQGSAREHQARLAGLLTLPGTADPASAKARPGEAAEAMPATSGGAPLTPPALWRLRAEASGGWSGPAGAAPGPLWLEEIAKGRLSWQGRVAQFDLLGGDSADAQLAAPAVLRDGQASGSAASAGAAGSTVVASVSSSTVTGQSVGNGLSTTAPNTTNTTSAPRLWPLALAPTELEIRPAGATAGLRLLAPTRVMLGDLQLLVDSLAWQQGSATGSGAAAAATDPHWQLRARLQPYALAPALARLQPGFGWGGNLRLGGQLQIARDASQGLHADIRLATQDGDLQVTDPENAAGPQWLGLRTLELQLSARDGLWRLVHRVDGSNLGRLSGEARIQARSAQALPQPGDPLSGQLELQIAQLGNWGRWLPAGWRLAGMVQGHLDLGGTLGGPQLAGLLQGQGIAVRNSLEGVNWTDASLRLGLDGETARIEDFTVHAGQGTLKATGQARLGAAPRIDVSLQASRFAALQRLDRKVVVSGQAQLGADARATTLTGKLVADEGRIDVSQGDAPSLSDDVTVRRGGRDGGNGGEGANNGAAQTPTAPRGAATNAKTPRRGLGLDLQADLGDNFELRGRGITAKLKGSLKLSSPNDRLSLSGDIRAEDGSYNAYGQKLGIDRGVIAFNGPMDNPRLDILATRPDLDDVKVGVAISGTAQSPRVRLFSEPEMSNTDKLSWLLLGRASDGLGSTDLSLLQRAAFSLLSGDSDSPTILQRIGLDQFGVRQTEGTVRDTVVSLGKQLSRRWYVGYERSLNAATGSWQLIYRLAQRFTLRAQSGQDNAVDLIWTWRWDERDATAPATPQPAPASAPAAASR